jgi:predicted ATPase
MISKLTVKNYRSLADVSISLGQLTVLVGVNGSGKSTIVDVLHFVADALRFGLETAILTRSGMGSLRRWSAKGKPYDVKIQFEVEGKVGGFYSFLLGSESRGEYRIKAEQCSAWLSFDANIPVEFEEYEIKNGQWVRQPFKNDLETRSLLPAIQSNALALPLLAGISPYNELYELLTNLSFYNIFPDILKDPQKPTNPYPLAENGTNLASVLRNQEKDSALKTALEYVLADVNDFQVSSVGSNLVVKLRHQATGENRAPWFELVQESDGTLRMLGILTALYQDPPRTLIVLEEPELTVHPGAMAKLWDEIQKASQHTQIILTTHSPDLLDLCAPEHLRVVEKINGATYVGPVEEAQQQIIRDRLFTAGQLLQAQGLRRAQGGGNGAQ